MGRAFQSYFEGMSVQKHYITPDSIRKDSYALGSKLLKDGFKPEFMVALWRGGAPIGCCIHEFLKWHDVDSDHIAIRTSRYTGVDQVGEGPVVVHSTSYLRERLKPGSTVLLVDDVWDSGKTIVAFFDKLETDLNFPVHELDIRVSARTGRNGFGRNRKGHGQGH